MCASECRGDPLARLTRTNGAAGKTRSYTTNSSITTTRSPTDILRRYANGFSRETRRWKAGPVRQRSPRRWRVRDIPERTVLRAHRRGRMIDRNRKRKKRRNEIRSIASWTNTPPYTVENRIHETLPNGRTINDNIIRVINIYIDIACVCVSIINLVRCSQNTLFINVFVWKEQGTYVLKEKERDRRNPSEQTRTKRTRSVFEHTFSGNIVGLKSAHAMAIFHASLLTTTTRRYWTPVLW